MKGIEKELKQQQLDQLTESQLKAVAQFTINLMAAVEMEYGMQDVARFAQIVTGVETELVSYLINTNLTIKNTLDESTK
tara:strand:- start:154 stop:390 length:237 start_codon:yes stop_codon:yes gene_type:complete